MQIKIKKFNDMHVHLREGALLSYVLRYLGPYHHVLVMPNLAEPVLTRERALHYEHLICHGRQYTGFVPLMTLQVTEETTPLVVKDAVGTVTACKVYPRGVTTNSSNGVADYTRVYPVLSAMEESDLVLCLHGEKPDEFCLDREERFLDTLADIVDRYPKLRIVLEHISTRAAVEFVKCAPVTVAATVTVHHLFLILDDVIGAELRPHHFCKPIAKRPSDRAALQEVVLSGHPRFFLGTDSAPHLRERKECSHGCAGIFSAPSAPALVCEFFGGDIAQINSFANEYAAAFYRIPPTCEYVTLERWDGSPERAQHVSTDGLCEIFSLSTDGTLPWRIVDID